MRDREEILADLGLGDEVDPADIGVIWKDLTPSDFPEAWRAVEDEEGMGFATLVEVMSESLEPHERERIIAAMRESADTSKVDVLLTNYKGEQPHKRTVKGVTSVSLVASEAEDDEEDDEDAMDLLLPDLNGRDAGRYPLLVLNKVNGRASFRLDEVVGWEETHE